MRHCAPGVESRAPYNRPMAFVHLRTHTEFSVVDGTLRIDDVAPAAKADGQLALGITDLSNLFGAIKFYKAVRGQGVKPIIGVDVWMDPLPDAADRVPTRLALLVQDTQGYLNLCELLGRSWTKNVQRAQAWVDRKSTRLNSSHLGTSYAVFCLKKKTKSRSNTASNRNKHKSPQLRGWRQII